MGCCGNKRRSVGSSGGSSAGGGARVQDVAAGSAARRYAQAYFQYVGRTGLTVVGPMTGRRYRFARPGDVVAVDPADRRAIANVPHLRQVAHP